MTKSIRNKKNRILAIPAAATATPLNPKIAATIATMKKISAQSNMLLFLFPVAIHEPEPGDQPGNVQISRHGKSRSKRRLTCFSQEKSTFALKSCRTEIRVSPYSVRDRRA
jgi:hypothetical protein